MIEFLKWRDLKIDTSPGSLTYAGPAHLHEPKLFELSYNTEHLDEHCITQATPLENSGDRTRLLHLTGVHDNTLMKQVGKWLQVHPLLLEDMMNTGQRPKLVPDNGALFMVFKDVSLDEATGRSQQHHVGLYWRNETVLAFQEHEEKPWDNVFERIRSGTGRIRGAGPSYLVVAFIDALVDNYYSVLGELSLRAENVESELEMKQTEIALMELYAIKREVVVLRSSFVAARENLERLATQDICTISEDNRPFLADVRDHAQQIVETATALHDILSDMLSVQISLASMKMNNVMKVLTIIATIFIPLTFISGVYGMNFINMPELQWAYGYPTVLGIMAALVGAMVYMFRRKEWF